MVAGHGAQGKEAIPRAQCNNRWDTQEGTGIGVTDRGQDSDKGRVGFIGGRAQVQGTRK